MSMNGLESRTFADGFRVCMLRAQCDRAQHTVGYEVSLFDGGRQVRQCAAVDQSFAPLPSFYGDLRRFLMQVMATPHVLAVCGPGWRELLRHALPRRLMNAFRVLDLMATVRAMAPGLPARPDERALRRCFRLDPHLCLEAPADFYPGLLWAVLSKAGNAGLDWTGLLSLADRSAAKVDFDRYAFAPEYLATLPPLPAVYVMRDSEDRVLYVGKTRDLARRMGEYFRGAEGMSARMIQIRELVRDFEFELVGCELAALLLEYRRIQEWQPARNVQRQVSEGAGRYGRRLAPVIVVERSAHGEGVELFGIGESELVHVTLRDPSPWHHRVKQVVTELLGGRRVRESRYSRHWGLEGCELGWRYFMRFRHSLQWCEVAGDHPVAELVDKVTGIVHLASSSEPESGEFRVLESL